MEPAPLLAAGSGGIHPTSIPYAFRMTGKVSTCGKRRHMQGSVKVILKAIECHLVSLPWLGNISLSTRRPMQATDA